jgi:hypothetical protein
VSDFDDPPPRVEAAGETPPEPTNAFFALDDAVTAFVESGWPLPAARLALECIAARLINTGSKYAAFESLRRDRSIRLQLDIDQDSWVRVLHAVLGHDNPNLQRTAVGRGILQRLLIGERTAEIFGTSAIASAIAASAPSEKEATHV